MLSLERNIRFYWLRGQLHLGLVRILFGEHKSEGRYIKFVAPFWWHRLANVAK